MFAQRREALDAPKVLPQVIKDYSIPFARSLPLTASSEVQALRFTTPPSRSMDAQKVALLAYNIKAPFCNT